MEKIRQDRAKKSGSCHNAWHKLRGRRHAAPDIACYMIVNIGTQR